MPDPTLDWRTREAIREEVKTGVTDALTLLGISNKDETRRDLDFWPSCGEATPPGSPMPGGRLGMSPAG
jgi:hypothetical protein